jgi:putative hydrolase of the HAD superfamily
VAGEIDAVVFDWGGTLTPWHTIDHREQWRAYTRVYDPERADELVGLLVAAEDAMWLRARDHQRSGTLEDLFAQVGVDASGERHQEALEAYHAFWEPHTWTDPDVPGLLAGLRDRGLKVAVLSNTLWPREFHEKVFARDGVLDLIDGAAYSSELPWTKPHPEAFRAAAAAVGVEDTGRVVFVGDRPFDDIHGAKQAGMRAVLVPHSDIPERQKGHVEGDPDAVVQRLADLLAVVDGWLAG